MTRRIQWAVQAISTMMEAVYDKPEVYPEMEVALLPMLRKMMAESARDYFEDVNEVRVEIAAPRQWWAQKMLHGRSTCRARCQVLSYLTYYSPSISDELWGIFPLLHEAFHTWAFECAVPKWLVARITSLHTRLGLRRECRGIGP